MRGTPLPRSTLRAEFAGGCASAAVGVALVLSTGVMAFAPLGAQFASIGVCAAFTAAIAGNVFATLLGGSRLGGSGPRASGALIVAALLLALSSDPDLAPQVHGPARLLAMMAASVALGGVLMVFFGVARLGRIVKFVPYPVVAGFMGGIAVLIVFAQLPPLAGIPGDGKAALSSLAQAQPATLAVGVGTALLIVGLGRRRMRRIPPLVVGLIAGTLAYHAVRASLPGVALGPTLGAFSPLLPLGDVWREGGVLLHGGEFAAHLRQVLGAAVVIAFICGLDSLLAAVAVDAKTATRHDPDRQLIGQGIGNIVTGLLCGLPVSYSFARAAPAYDAGARRQAAEMFASGLLLVVLVAGHGALAAVPLTVIAGVMLTVALVLIDDWTKRLFGQLRASGNSRDIVYQAATVVVVAAITIAVDFVIAVAAGVVLAMVLFIAASQHSLVRAVRTGATLASRRDYPTAHSAALRQHGERTCVLDLEGALFFGTGDRLGDEVRQQAAGADTIILNFARVTAIDETAVQTLLALDRRLARAGKTLYFAHVTPGGRLGHALREFARATPDHECRWFPDLDHALEAAELALLGRLGMDFDRRELLLPEFSLCRGLAAEDLAALAARLERLEVPAGQVLFREGDAGDRLYLLARGAIHIMAADRHDKARLHRIVTFSPGAAFGEMAMLGHGPRSATAVADVDSIVHVLTTADLAALAQARPHIETRILANLARHLSDRLRVTTEALRAA